MPYDQIPQLYLSQSGDKYGYRMQRGICERRMYNEEKELYFKFFGKSQAELFNVANQSLFGNSYNSLNFYPL